MDAKTDTMPFQNKQKKVKPMAAGIDRVDALRIKLWPHGTNEQPQGVFAKTSSLERWLQLSSEILKRFSQALQDAIPS
jgi:hypothetical protein